VPPPADRDDAAHVPLARSRLWISNAYFTPSEDIVSQLESRARSGVDVRLLLPGPIHDQPAMRDGQRSLYGGCSQRGEDLEYPALDDAFEDACGGRTH
jgi:hypothetical protein